MNCLFVYNPQSGKGNLIKRLPYIEEKLKERFENVTVSPSQCAGDLVRQASEACGKYDYLIFAGGDGSFNEVLNGISEKENKPILGYIPTGTVNDIARSLKLPRSNVKKCVKKLINYSERSLDVMKVNDKYAEYEICAGALTSCSYKAPRKAKVNYGRLAYAFECLKHNLKLKDFEIEITCNGETLKTNCEFVIFLNSKSVASMRVNPKAVLDDGEIEVLLIKQVKRPRWYHKFSAFFNVLGFFIFGYNSAKRKMVYTKFKGSSFKVTAPSDLVWNFDGEEGQKGNVEITVLKEHIRILSK